MKNYLEHDKKINRNLNKFHEDLRAKYLNEAQEKEANFKNRLNESAKTLGSVNSRKNERRKQLQETIECKELVTKNLLIEALNTIFYESLMIDDDFKLNNSTRLLEFSNGVFEALFKNQILTEDTFANTNSVYVRSIYEICNEAATAISSLLVNKDNTKEEVSKILARAGIAIDAKAEHINDIIKTKVVDVVKAERDKAEANQDRMKIIADDPNANKFVRKEEPTVLSSLIIGCVKNGNTNSVDTESALAEGVITYTLLESLNTMKLVDMTPKDWSIFARTFRM